MNVRLRPAFETGSHGNGPVEMGVEQRTRGRRHGQVTPVKSKGPDARGMVKVDLIVRNWKGWGKAA